ncbi:MAG: hypothetical protein ABI675_01090 [Chitinophagaceae bacterium]
MKKQLGLITRSRLAVDPWSRNSYPLPDIPIYAFSRHLRRREKRRYRNGTAILDISGGWYIHSYRNGLRMLSSLPF